MNVSAPGRRRLGAASRRLLRFSSKAARFVAPVIRAFILLSPGHQGRGMKRSRRRRAILGIGTSVLLLAVAATANAARPAQAKATIEARETFFGPKNIDRRGMLAEGPRHRLVVRSLESRGFVQRQGGAAGHVSEQRPAGVVRRSAVHAPQRYGSDSGDTPVKLRATRPRSKPKAIFVGHGHFDHECMTGPIAAHAGARVVGLPQHCDAGAVAGDRCRV